MEKDFKLTPPSKQIEEKYAYNSTVNVPGFIRGRVISVNTYSFTADVYLAKGNILSDCPILNIMGSNTGRDIVWLQDLQNAEVVLINLSGMYYILATIPSKSDERLTRGEDSFVTDGISEGEDKDTYAKAWGKTYKNKRSSDFLGEDKVIKGRDGVLLGLLRGGIAKIKASSLAQIILFRFKDLIRVVARNLQVWTDFGKIEITQTALGDTALNIKGGSNFKSESGPDKELWSVFATLGSVDEDTDARVYIKARAPKVDPDTNIVNDGNYSTLRMGIDGNTKFDNSSKFEVEANTGINLSTLTSINISAVMSKSELVGLNSSETVVGFKSSTSVGPMTISSYSIMKLSAPLIMIN